MGRPFVVAFASIGLTVAAAAGPLAAQRSSAQAPEVLVLAPEIEGPGDTALARLAQRFTARLLQRLAEARVRAMRAERGMLDSLRGAKAAPFTLDASLTGEPGRFSAELRLLELGSGDELRTYMFGPGDADGVLGLADRAPPRIAAALTEAGKGR